MALEKRAKCLFAEAEQVREDARKTADEAFVAEHGFPITDTNFFVIPNPGKSALPSSEKERIDYLVEEINSGRIKSTATGWGQDFNSCLVRAHQVVTEQSKLPRNGQKPTIGSDVHKLP